MEPNRNISLFQLAGMTAQSGRIGIDETSKANYYDIRVYNGRSIDVDPIEVRSFVHSMPSFLTNTDGETQKKFLDEFAEVLKSGSYDLIGNFINTWVATVEVDSVPGANQRLAELASQIDEGDYIEWDPKPTSKC